MGDQMKAIEETRAIRELAPVALHFVKNHHGLLEPTAKEHARVQAISLLTQIEEHVKTALAALGA